MAQNELTLPDSGGGPYRAEDNDRAKAIASWNAGAGDPPEPIAYMQKLDLTDAELKIRNAANNAWHTMAKWTGTKMIWLHTQIKELTVLAAPAVADKIAIFDASADENRSITLPDFFKVISGFTEAVSLQGSLDFVPIWDESAGAVRKVKASLLGGALTQFYESPEQVVTAGGTLTLAHGLTKQPAIYKSFLKFVVAEAGYAIGDEVEVSALQEGSDLSVARGVAVVPDATNLVARFGTTSSTFAMLRKDTGSLIGLSNASVRLIVRAWA